MAMTWLLFPEVLDKAHCRPDVGRSTVFNRRLSLLSLSRIFLFGGRDAWFAIAFPLALYLMLGEAPLPAGGVIAAWLFLYAAVQMSAQTWLRTASYGEAEP